MNNWEKLCEKVNYLIKIKVKDEESFHLAVKEQLETDLEWPSQYIKFEGKVKKGRMDLFLKGNNFGIVIEMKTLNNQLLGNEYEQLKDYMKKVNCRYGLLIGKLVRVYFKETLDDEPKLVASFGFDKDNKDGISLFELLSYKNCSDKEIENWMKLPHETGDLIDPNLWNEIFKHIRQEFIDPKAGFEMEERLTGEHWLASIPKNGVRFVPQFYKNLLKGGLPIWQVIWENHGNRFIQNRELFEKKYKHIKEKLYTNCYFKLGKTTKAYIGIPVKVENTSSDKIYNINNKKIIINDEIIQDMIDVVIKTKEIMEKEKI